MHPENIKLLLAMWPDLTDAQLTKIAANFADFPNGRFVSRALLPKQSKQSKQAKRRP